VTVLRDNHLRRTGALRAAQREGSFSYPALLRMEQEGWISSRWGTSENNRKAKFYAITAAGRRQLAKETDDWRRMSSIIERFLTIDPTSLTKEEA